MQELYHFNNQTIKSHNQKLDIYFWSSSLLYWWYSRRAVVIIWIRWEEVLIGRHSLRSRRSKRWNCKLRIRGRLWGSRMHGRSFKTFFSTPSGWNVSQGKIIPIFAGRSGWARRSRASTLHQPPSLMRTSSWGQNYDLLHHHLLCNTRKMRRRRGS